jgi:hypothetical protein
VTVLAKKQFPEDGSRPLSFWTLPITQYSKEDILQHQMLDGPNNSVIPSPEPFRIDLFHPYFLEYIFIPVFLLHLLHIPSISFPVYSRHL